MSTATEYARIRHASPGYPAQHAIREARNRDRFNRLFTLTGDGAVSDDGSVRIRIVPDDEPYDPGTMFDESEADSIPGGLRALKAQEKAFWDKLERDGVWGFIVEKKCPKCGNWEHVDSCFGFDDSEYCFSQAIPAALAALED